MDQQNIFRLLRSFHLPVYFKFSFVVLVLAIVLFSIQSYRGSRKAIEQLNQYYASTDTLIQAVTNDDGIFTLLKRQSFLNTSLKQADSDSIGLCINLVDSTIALRLKGVELHGSKISGFSTSSIFDKMDISSLIELLSQPLLISEDTANTLKEPIKRVKAPKNEDEAAKMIIENVPDTLMEFVAIRLVLDNNIIVMIEENPDSVPKNAVAYMEFLNAINRKKSIAFWKSLVTMRAPSYQPWIKIYLPAEEVKSIYRALPKKGTAILNV